MRSAPRWIAQYFTTGGLSPPRLAGTLPGFSILRWNGVCYGCVPCRKGGPHHENGFRNRPISGGCDLSCFWAERISALHSASTSGWRRGAVHGCPVRLPLPDACLRASSDRGSASVGEPLRAPGACHPGAGDRQHSCISRFDGTEWTPPRPLRDGTLGLDLRRCAIGLCRTVAGAPAATGLTRRRGDDSWLPRSPMSKNIPVSSTTSGERPATTGSSRSTSPTAEGSLPVSRPALAL